MNNKICYFENRTADKLQESITQNVIYRDKKNFLKIQHWNKYTGEIPSTENLADGFKKYYLSKVIDHNVLEDLENEKIINAVPNLSKLYPIITPSDGNCLCHAVSLYLWGIPDRGNFLRQLLYVTLVTDENKLLQRLYMQHVSLQQFSEENSCTEILSKQWDRLVLETQEIPMNSGSSHLVPLEAIHIFILANILLRPIIVLSSPVVRTVFNHSIQTNNIGGIYLPLLCHPNDTEKSPIVLGFHMNHFTPLIHIENSPQMKAIPLKRMELMSLPLHFSQDLLPDSIAKMLKTYLNIDTRTESALIMQVPLPKNQNMFYAHFEHCKVLYDNAKGPVTGKAASKDIGMTNINDWNGAFFERHGETIHIISSSLQKSPTLCINNCGMYGAAELGNKCSKCFATNSQVSVTTPQSNAEQPKITNEDDWGQNIHEKFPQYTLEQLAPTRENKSSVLLLRKSQEMSVQDKQNKPQTIPHFETQNKSTQFIVSPQLMLQPHGQKTLETATCITPGCHAKAHRKLQYRCGSCFVKRNNQSAGGASVLKENDLKTVDNFSPLSDNLSGQGAIAKSANLITIDRTKIPTQESSQSIEDTQVSLLDLLCSEENCPNRRMSPSHSKCSSCSEKAGKFFCSTPGCMNQRQQNKHFMCGYCFQKNELERQKISTQRNTVNHIPDYDGSYTNHERRKCDKPNCINSRGSHSTGYCIKCYAFMEKAEHPQPTAPSFPN